MEFKDIIVELEKYIGKDANHISDTLYAFPNVDVKKTDEGFSATIGSSKTLKGIVISNSDEHRFIADVITKYYSFAESPYYSLLGLSFVVYKALLEGTDTEFKIQVCENNYIIIKVCNNTFTCIPDIFTLVEEDIKIIKEIRDMLDVGLNVNKEWTLEVLKTYNVG